MSQDILTFWFAPDTRRFWFERNLEFDRELKRRFEEGLWLAACTATTGDPADARATLARCILLDQVPRNIYRGTPRAYAYDRLAREAVGAALEAGLDSGLEPTERLFLYLPFEHSEDLADQDRAVALFAALGNPEWLDYAERHRTIIRRFGRFPHRNAVLGRRSTREEETFLQEPGSSF
jgi:uncharacterized protein (DUF924 family)